MEGYLAFIGSKTEEVFRSYSVDKSIFSCKALDSTCGVMESREAFGYVKKAMMESAKTNILVVDSSKFDQTAFMVSGDLRNVDIVVTDVRPSDSWVKLFEEKGTELLYPGLEVPEEGE